MADLDDDQVDSYERLKRLTAEGSSPIAWRFDPRDLAVAVAITILGIAVIVARYAFFPPSPLLSPSQYYPVTHVVGVDEQIQALERGMDERIKSAEKRLENLDATVRDLKAEIHELRKISRQDQGDRPAVHPHGFNQTDIDGFLGDYRKNPAPSPKPSPEVGVDRPPIPSAIPVTITIPVVPATPPTPVKPKP